LQTREYPENDKERRGKREEKRESAKRKRGERV